MKFTPQRFTVLAAAGIAVIAIVFFLVRSPNTIVLKDDGFHPRTLTVQVGETVTFKSERGKYFWPASDFHPTHALYPAFDPKEPIAPDGSWSYTFTESGVYKFHDHLSAFYFGIIRVVDMDGKLVDNCMNRGGQLECWQNDIFLILANKGVDAAYDKVTELYEAEPAFSQSCHYVTHNIGLASYQFYREDPDSIFSAKAIACAAGFYHGFMEGMLGATGETKAAAAVCEAIDEAVGEEAPDSRLQCYHGIGHGAMETAVASTGSFGNIDETIGSAIKMCEEASEGVEERYRCVSGIYNGIANFYINGSYGLSIEQSSPVALCARQQEVYKEACYGNLNSVALWAADNDFSKATPYILSVPDQEYLGRAVQYLAGLYAVGHVADTSFAPVVQECRALPSLYQLDCIQGFAHGLLEHGSPGLEYKQAIMFCREPSLTARERDTCFTESLGTLPGWYSEAVSLAICESVEPELRHYCAK